LQARQAADAAWNQEIDDDVRMRMRTLGRRLIGLIGDYLAAAGAHGAGRSRRGRLLDEARALGHEYGQELAAGRLPLSTTVQAFTFFRRSLDATAEQLAARHNLSAEQAADAREHLADVADTVLLAITRSYEDRQHAAGRWGAER
jgi:hypothetical protein